MAALADKIHGETIPYLNDYTVYTLREPHGVTGHIIPVELSDADPGPFGRSRPGDGQRRCSEAG
jgi:hypothetical protein